ncbi:MAG: UpxY family transcription antiterminator [Bacteroidota bacterium]
MKDSKNWFVLRTKPRQEKKAAAYLSDAGFEVYIPLRETIKIWSDRKKKVKEPIIPSYIFIHISEKYRTSIFPAVGISNYMYWLKKPVIIRDKEMEQMQRWFNDHAQEEIKSREISVGNEVRIESGILLGKQGIVEKIGSRFITLSIPQLGVKLQVDKPKTIIKVVKGND